MRRPIRFHVTADSNENSEIGTVLVSDRKNLTVFTWPVWQHTIPMIVSRFIKKW